MFINSHRITMHRYEGWDGNQLKYGAGAGGDCCRHQRRIEKQVVLDQIILELFLETKITKVLYFGHMRILIGEGSNAGK